MKQTDALRELANHPRLDTRIREKAIRRLAELGDFDLVHSIATDVRVDTHVGYSAVWAPRTHWANGATAGDRSR